MAEHERVLVKHAVTGRMLINSMDGVAYSFNEEGGLTLITLTEVEAEKGLAVVELKAELNVFRFEEPEDGPVIKHWYYVGDNPVTYDADSRRLTIAVQSEIEYRPDQYWA